ncbi:MAG: N-acetylglucosamine kinase-like BadF-type ATPase [Arenicella sp.]
MYYLGVDGGGTKTAFVLLDLQHNVLATYETGTCYYIEVGMDGARAVLERGVNALLKQVNASVDDITYAFFGLPAFGEDSALLSEMNALPSGFMNPEKYRCDNDMVNGWAAAFGSNDGINIVAGTGSIAFGVKGDHHARCGGWGEIFSDEGSAYWIGCKGLQAFTKMSDGRCKKGALYQIVKSRFELHYDLDITAIVLSEWKSDRSKVATLSALVCEAANAGDQYAQDIFNEAAEELACMVEGVRLSLNYAENENINVSYSGGVFNAGDYIMQPFLKALSHYSSQYTLNDPLYSPAVGAALYASKLAC